ncbi:MAG: hypothetical protein ABI442_00535 [Gemmatimonadaceae bacterium]
MMLRGGAVAIVAGLFITAGILGATAMRGRGEARHPAAAVVAPAAVAAPAAIVTPEPVVSTTAGTLATDTAANVAPAGNPSAGASGVNGPQTVPPFGPILPVGESPIAEGVTATRTDSSIVVSFDSPLVRTRKPEKFESLVRATLPAIYGRGADSALAHMPEGGLMRQGDLMAVLPTRGIRIPAGEAWEIRLYPETRTGQDGPIVVRYRVSLVGSSE